MILNFSAFDTAISKLGQTIVDSSAGAQKLLSDLSDLQAQLDSLRLDTKAKADQLRAEGSQHDG